MSIFKGIDSLERGLSASWQRNRVILDNVANVDTPYFKTSEVQFESLYRSALENSDNGVPSKKTRATHEDFGTPDPSDVVAVVVERSDTIERMDESNVDIDREMTDYAKNYIYYNTLMRKVNGQFTQLRSAIAGQ